MDASGQGILVVKLSSKEVVAKLLARSPILLGDRLISLIPQYPNAQDSSTPYDPYFPSPVDKFEHLITDLSALWHTLDRFFQRCA